MSSDNGIYILKSKDGYRVVHTQAIENIYWWNVENPDTRKWKKKSKINPIELKEYFGESKVFKTENEVLKEAIQLQKKYEMVEYGICYIRGWENEKFPK